MRCQYKQDIFVLFVIPILNITCNLVPNLATNFVPNVGQSI